MGLEHSWALLFDGSGELLGIVRWEGKLPCDMMLEGTRNVCFLRDTAFFAGLGRVGMRVLLLGTASSPAQI